MKAGVVASFFIVLSGIFSAWYSQSQSIRLDESQSLWVATKPISAILHLTAQDVHVPLYSLLLHLWLQVWGNNVLAARMLSVVFFLMTIPSLLALSHRLSNTRIAITTIALFCLSPFVLWYANEARMYTLFALITTLHQFYFLILIDTNWQRGKAEWLVLYILGLYTHYFFGLLIVAQFAYLVWIHFAKIKSIFSSGFSAVNKKDFIGFFWFFSLSFLAGIAFLPWVIYFISQGSASGTKPLLPPPSSYSVLELFVNFLVGFPQQFIQSVIISLWPLLLGVMFFIFSGYRKIRLKHIGYFFTTIVLSLMIVFWASFVRPVFLSRYLIFIIPSTFILVASILDLIKPPLKNIVISTVLIGMFLMSFHQNSSQITAVREDYRGVNQFLSENVTGRDLIVVSAPFTIYPIEYYYLGPARIVTLPEWDRFSQAMPGFDPGQMEEQIESYQGVYERVFFVLSYDQGYQDEVSTYLENNYQLLEKMTFKPKINVLVYKFSYQN